MQSRLNFLNRFFIFVFFKRNGLESNTLRFLAKIHTKDPIQAERRFIISYFLSDDSIHVHEPPVKNSGFICFLIKFIQKLFILFYLIL